MTNQYLETFRELIRGYQAAHVPELAFRDRMLTLLEKSKEKSFQRSNFPAHFTASALIVNQDKSHVCLVLHKKFGVWLQPGGHVEEGDNLDMRQACLREAREETGLDVALNNVSNTIFDVDIHMISARANEPEHEHFDVRFRINAPRSSTQEWECDGTKVRWFEKKEALAICEDASVRRLISKIG